MRKWTVIACACLLIWLTACGQGDKIQTVGGKKEEQQKKIKVLSEAERKNVLAKVDQDMTQAGRDFALRLHQSLATELEQENLILSPYSITQALALAYNGAAGDTAAEMSAMLGWKDQPLADVNEGNHQLSTLLERGNGVVLNVANSVWYQQGVAMKKDYLNTLQDSYGAVVKGTHLGEDKAMNQINDWVNKKTEGMIPSIFSEPPGGVAVLINAIYFNGGWKDEFDPANTVDESFTLANGNSKQIPMMKREGKYEYKEGEDWQAIRIPYAEGQMHMLVILPKASSSLATLHQELWEDASAWEEGFSYETVKLSLPRFKAEQSFELPKTLQGLGMVKAFDPLEADFTAMAEGGDGFYIDEVKHKAVVDVSETGTKAAAVTSVGVVASAEPPSEPIEMDVNRPFFFAIEDRDTGSWVFIGSVFDPRA